MTPDLQPKIAAPRKTPWSRWDYRGDRHNFNRWLEAKRPCRGLDWSTRFDGGHVGLVIKVEPVGTKLRRWYGLTELDLEMHRMGWRWVVAQAIRKCREAIRKQLA